MRSSASPSLDPAPVDIEDGVVDVGPAPRRASRPLAPARLGACAPAAAVVAAVAVAVVVGGGVACAPATVPGAKGLPPQGAFEACAIEPERFVVVEAGTVPLVITSTHAGTTEPLGCDAGSSVLRDLAHRACTPSLDMVCESGPCRAGGPDHNARELTFALQDDLEQCLGGRPSLVLTEVERTVVDMNRDAADPGGLRCAMEDPAAAPYWEAFQRAVEGEVARAVDAAGDGALLIDVHTYASLPAAPPPAMMIGTGNPVGLTTPHRRADDPTLGFLFGPGGLRAHLLQGLHAEDPAAAVYPQSAGQALDGLFNGRYIVRRYSRNVDDDTREAGPAIDSIQLETSSGLRDDVDATALSIASALCDVFGDRLRGGVRGGTP